MFIRASIFNSIMAKREEIRLVRYWYRGDERIKVINKENVVLKSFIYDERKKHMTNFSKDNRANEESILNYFAQNHEKLTGEPYKKLSKEEFNNQLNKLNQKKKSQKYKKKEKIFKKGSSILFTNKKRIKTFDYTYISVIVKVFFNGFYTETSGRSDYIQNRQIGDSEIPDLINIAVRRAVAPFGSNVNFKLVEWNLAYYRDEFTNAQLRGEEVPITYQP